MNAPLPVPLRILVRGPSTVGYASSTGVRGRTTFPRIVENTLLHNGRPAVVMTDSVASEPAKWLVRNWEADVVGFHPDVIIIGSLTYEVLHLFLPRWLERWSNSTRVYDRPVRAFLRRRVLRKIWRSLAVVQSKVDRRYKGAQRRRPTNVAKDVTRFVKQTRDHGRPLVLILELMPPASRARKWFPGMSIRVPVTNELLREVPSQFPTGEVEFFEVQKLAATLSDDLDVLLPDGLHYSYDLHQVVGEALAQRILAWDDAGRGEDSAL